jgi:hypothetical protein
VDWSADELRATLNLNHKAVGLPHRFYRKTSCNRVLERFAAETMDGKAMRLKPGVPSSYPQMKTFRSRVAALAKYADVP